MGACCCKYVGFIESDLRVEVECAMHVLPALLRGTCHVQMCRC